MENILKDKNENVSPGQLNFPSKSETENLSSDNMKENNPKSLLEIATDTTSRFQLNASTPKITKRNSSLRDSTFNANSNGNNSPACPETSCSDPNSISFLLNGLNNLKLKGAEDEISEDEDQFLSFNDMSNRVEDETMVLEKSNSEIKSVGNKPNGNTTFENTTASIGHDNEHDVKITNVNESLSHSSDQNGNKFIDEKSPGTIHEYENEENIPIINNTIENYQCDSSAEEKTLTANVETEIKETMNPTNIECDAFTKNDGDLNQSNNIETTSENRSFNATRILNDSKQNTSFNATSHASTENVEENHNEVKDENCINESYDVQVLSKGLNDETFAHANSESNMQNNEVTCVMGSAGIEIKETVNPTNIECDTLTKDEGDLNQFNNIESTFENRSINAIRILNDSKQNMSFNATSEVSTENIVEHPDELKNEHDAVQTISSGLNDQTFAQANSEINMQNNQLKMAKGESHLNNTFDAPKNEIVEPTELPINKNLQQISTVIVCSDEMDWEDNIPQPKSEENTFKPTFEEKSTQPKSNVNNPFEDSNCNNYNFQESLQPNFDVMFKMPSAPIMSSKTAEKEEFADSASYKFSDSDFEILQKFGSKPSNHDIARDSLLLKFDPLLAKPIPQFSLNFERLTEEEENLPEIVHKEICQKAEDTAVISSDSCKQTVDEFPQLIPLEKEMNVEIMKDIVSENEKQIDNNFECEETKLSSIDHHENQNNKLMELENKMRMEAEQREEVLLKRISEKDKQISKMNNVVKEYEKAIAELIAEKEQLVQNYEKKCNDLKNDSEMNANHLGSLELTFSDLHAKYERTKQVAFDFKKNEEGLIRDRQTLLDSLKMQEARYDKMKLHAMSQLEIANTTLAEMLRNHQAEVTKLKAQLKKEEISRASINEQLIQKSKENAELVKICDELIGNHGNSHTN